MRSLVITFQKRYECARRGEAVVTVWLIQSGFQVIVRNFRRKAFELDVGAIKERELLILEVKTRANTVGDWQQLISPRKLSALWRGTKHFLQEHPQYNDCTLHLGLAQVAATRNNAITWMRLPTGLEDIR